MIPLRINLYASLQKLEDESKFGPEETFLILPGRRLHQSTFKKWDNFCNEFKNPYTSKRQTFDLAGLWPD